MDGVAISPLRKSSGLPFLESRCPLTLATYLDRSYPELFLSLLPSTRLLCKSRQRRKQSSMGAR